MTKFDDYINDLEGKDNLDPLAIARDLRELHSQEVSTREAKITELNTEKQELSSTVVAKETEITTWKAKNFDLAMQIPGAPEKEQTRNEDEKPDASTIRTADLFSPDVRKRNPHFRTGR